MTVAVQHVRFGNLIVALGHQSNLNLVLNLLHADTALDIQMAQDSGHNLFSCKCTRSQERLGDSGLNLVNGKHLVFAISFYNICLHK